MLSSFVMSLTIRLTNNQILHITNFMTLIDFLFNFNPQKVLCIKFTELKKKISYPRCHHYDNTQADGYEEDVEGVFVIHHPHSQAQHPQGHQKTVHLLWQTCHGQGSDPE